MQRYHFPDDGREGIKGNIYWFRIVNYSFSGTTGKEPFFQIDGGSIVRLRSYAGYISPGYIGPIASGDQSPLTLPGPKPSNFELGLWRLLGTDALHSPKYTSTGKLGGEPWHTIQFWGGNDPPGSDFPGDLTTGLDVEYSSDPFEPYPGPIGTREGLRISLTAIGGAAGSRRYDGTQGPLASDRLLETILVGMKAGVPTELLVDPATGNLLVSSAIVGTVTITPTDWLKDTTFTGRINTLGQKLMASSTPVVLASDQSVILVSGPLTDAQLRALAVPVSGPLTDAQLAARLPLSVTGPLTDAQLRASPPGVNLSQVGGAAVSEGQKVMAASVPVVLASDQSAIQVSGPLTDAQLAARLPLSVRLQDGTSAVLETIKAASTLPVATDTALVVTQRELVGIKGAEGNPVNSEGLLNALRVVAGDITDLCVTATGAAGALVQCILPAPGIARFIYVKKIEICKFAAALLVAGAAPIGVVTAGLIGLPVFDFEASAMAAGTQVVRILDFQRWKGTAANTAASVSGPGTANVIWRITVWYHTLGST